MEPPLHVKILNYSLIVSVFFWGLIAASVMLSLEYSVGTLLLWVALALLGVSIIGIWKYDPYYYKVVFSIMACILVLNAVFGKGVGPEVVPILLSLYLWTHERHPSVQVKNLLRIK